MDWKNLGPYSENLRLEAKKALGGLPLSIWETYSAFANTLGGTILLGVEEAEDKTLHPICLPNPQRLLNEFLALSRNSMKVSSNLVASGGAKIVECEGKRIIAIEILRAERKDRPVYINNDPFTGTYRRIGEADMHCSREEVKSMLREQQSWPQDMALATDSSISSFEKGAVGRYAKSLKSSLLDPSLAKLEESELLYEIGCVDYDEEAGLIPTVAGLLCFGVESDIINCCPGYFLAYKEFGEEGDSALFQFDSSDEGWSGNIFDFYCKASKRINSLYGSGQFSRLASKLLSNALMHADFFSQGGLIIRCWPNKAEASYPGSMGAIRSEMFDPRNRAVSKVLNLANIGIPSPNSSVYSEFESLSHLGLSLIEEYSYDKTKTTICFLEREFRPA